MYFGAPQKTFYCASIYAGVLFTIASTTSASQTVPIDIVDFQQYNAYQEYLKKEATHKVFVISDHMKPGSGYGWANSIEEATQYAADACKERFFWDCQAVSIDGKALGATRTIPNIIPQPTSIINVNIEDQTEEVKSLFKGYTFTNMYIKFKSHKAFAMNNFGATGQGYGEGYITEEIAKEKALIHCKFASSRDGIPMSRQQPCYVVAVNDRLIPENIKRVLAQKEESIELLSSGKLTEKWHGKYNMDLSKMAAALGVDEGEKIYYLFDSLGFQIKQGDRVMSSGTYQKNDNIISLNYVTGDADPQKRKLVLSRDTKSLTFEDKKYANIIFIKE